ncbi:MAG TPA: TIGR02757 family protein [Ignavibacteriaceae bacterium]|nr:TIGR02757 family protein [Ignavibacteriaceae bacterium]
MTLEQKLNFHYKAFDKSQISPDPLQFLHLFKNEKDIESFGFIASVFAYGNVRQIINTLDKILIITNAKPQNFITNFNRSENWIKLKGLKHRFYTDEDIINLFLALQSIYKKEGSLKNVFLKYYSGDNKNIKEALSGFSNAFINKIKLKTNKSKVSLGVRFMFPLPELGSACKRMNLFLRWMIRKDDLDFGLWNEIPANKLVIPVDTHVARICKQLKLTNYKNVSWKMAEEITDNLMKFDPVDPVKYDFAICHIGMRKMEF